MSRHVAEYRAFDGENSHLEVAWCRTRALISQRFSASFSIMKFISWSWAESAVFCTGRPSRPLTSTSCTLGHPENVERLLAALEALNARDRGQGQRRIQPQRSHWSSPGHQLLITLMRGHTCDRRSRPPRRRSPALRRSPPASRRYPKSTLLDIHCSMSSLSLFAAEGR